MTQPSRTTESMYPDYGAMRRIMQRIREEQGVSILLVEQNANLALELADRAYLLETGRIVIAGPAAEIRQDEAIRRSYLGY